MGVGYVIVHTIGGLGLFIFGMRMMSESLQRVAGDRLRKFLETVSANRVVACLTGALVTALVQSSSATTVMLVGFVNAGLMSLTQAIGVALGANIGTTVTAQLIAFKITDMALPAIALGVAMRLFSKKKRTIDLGGVVLGFGLLFYGMVIMKMGVAPLKNDPMVMDFFTRFATDDLTGILLCVLTGTIVTMVLQSSSATVGLTMTLALEGLIDFPTSVALILGDNIGTTITAELASIGTGVNAHRTARAHTMFNVLGVTYMVILFPWFVELVTWVTGALFGIGPPDALINGERQNIGRYIANAHTMFNVINAMVFLLLLPVLVRVATALTFSREPEPDLDILKPKYLDEQFMDVIPVAVKQARQEIIRMSEVCEQMITEVIRAMEIRKMKALAHWRHQEDALDILQREITQYLVAVSQRDMSLSASKEISSLMRITNNIERVGDSVQNIAELIEEMIENDIQLSEEGMRDYKIISDKALEFYSFILKSMKEGRTDIMDEAREMEDAIDLMREEMRGMHLSRLRNGVCTLDPGLVFTDILNHFEKVGDYCFNVAQGVAGIK